MITIAIMILTKRTRSVSKFLVETAWIKLAAKHSIGLGKPLTIRVRPVKCLKKRPHESSMVDIDVTVMLSPDPTLRAQDLVYMRWVIVEFC